MKRELSNLKKLLKQFLGMSNSEVYYRVFPKAVEVKVESGKKRGITKPISVQ